jgi:L,D-peptidoglycan transpeptidase YkuD (ErfK/YbiS/YcfS/YnhG family)
MRKKSKVWISIGSGLILGTMAYIFFSYPLPPVEEINEARQKLNEIEQAELSSFASKSYKETLAAYDSAMKYWQIENSKIFLFRNFDKVSEYAQLAIKTGEQTIQLASVARKGLADKSKVQIEQVRNKLNLYNKLYQNIPIGAELQRSLAQAKLLFEEGVSADNMNNYELSINKTDSSYILITSVLNYSSATLKSYLVQHPEWNKQATAAIARSAKQKNSLILIDKYARQCQIYQSGKLVGSYTSELGSNWIGDKNRQGDKSTPEGLYKVLSKKDKGSTKYYKALLLNYPNADDKKRFAEGQKSGKISKGASIGNLIEIHGHGGKGVDWTDGCIALTDSDMDKLYKLSAVGTEVLIVGSLKSLEQIKSQE